MECAAHRGRRSLSPTASATSTPIVRTGMPTSRQALRKTCTMRYLAAHLAFVDDPEVHEREGEDGQPGDGHDDEPATPRHRLTITEKVLERRRRILGRAGGADRAAPPCYAAW